MPMEKSGLEGLAQPWGHVLLARQGLSRQTVIAYLQDIGSFLKFWNKASQGSRAFPGSGIAALPHAPRPGVFRPCALFLILQLMKVF